MKEFKGTPGPWIVQNKSAVVSVSKSVIATNGEHVAELAFDWQGDFTGTITANNSNLIAASPSLLSALQRLIEVYDDPTGKQWTTKSKREALDKAREAINLALGE